MEQLCAHTGWIPGVNSWMLPSSRSLRL